MTHTSKCRCKIEGISDGKPRIVFCHLHAAAKEMLEAIEMFNTEFNSARFTDRVGYGKITQDLIAKAEGRHE